MMAHTIILRYRVYGFHSRNHGFLISGMAVSKTPDTGVTEPGILSYHELIAAIEEKNIAAVTNPGFELFLLLHIEGSFEQYIQGHELEYLQRDRKGKYSHAYHVLLELTGMNAKSNARIGELADHVLVAIAQEKRINQDIHQLKGKVSSNVGKIIEDIIHENPHI